MNIARRPVANPNQIRLQFALEYGLGLPLATSGLHRAFILQTKCLRSTVGHLTFVLPRTFVESTVDHFELLMDVFLVGVTCVLLLSHLSLTCKYVLMCHCYLDVAFALGATILTQRSLSHRASWHGLQHFTPCWKPCRPTPVQPNDFARYICPAFSTRSFLLAFSAPSTKCFVEGWPISMRLRDVPT